MPEKKWNVSYKGLDIEVHNSWSFSGEVSEKLFVNGELVDINENRFKPGDTVKDWSTGHLKATINNQKVEAKLGSIWFGFSVGCHILVDDELVGGNTKWKLMFVK